MTPNHVKDQIATIRKKSETLIPSHMVAPLALYVEQGIPSGGFMRAVLENNLVGAFAAADHMNIEAMKGWAQLIHWELPSGCHGSKADVDEWVKAGGLIGLHRRAAEIAREASTDVPGDNS